MAKIPLDYIIDMPQKISQLLHDGIARLQKAGVSESELSARLLLQHVLKKKRIQLQLAYSEIADDNAIEEYYKLIDKRCNHYPVQYIVGEVEFYNIKLKVNEHVLIPRPETEELIEYLLNIIKERSYLRILDIGAGSGNIAISLAANLNDAIITSIDISNDALIVAKDNAKTNQVSPKIKFIQADCLSDDFWSSIGRFDVIVSNPPYVDKTDYEALQPEVKLYEPKTALVPGDDPFVFYETIARHAESSLNSQGIVCFEIGFGQAEQIENIIRNALPSASLEIINDLSGIPRIVIGRLC